MPRNLNEIVRSRILLLIEILRHLSLPPPPPGGGKGAENLEKYREIGKKTLKKVGDEAGKMRRKRFQNGAVWVKITFIFDRRALLLYFLTSPIGLSFLRVSFFSLINSQLLFFHLKIFGFTIWVQKFFP
jgi:hypothetical protein